MVDAEFANFNIWSTKWGHVTHVTTIFSIMTLSIMTLNIMTLSIMTLIIMTLSMTVNKM